jgi:UDP:flavonoid glycosyltransferase YjiC (YdhE family)
LTQFGEQVPKDLPETVKHFRYAPFSLVLPRAAALVHHGGIGTTSQALAAGIPQLITPFNFDQPDNAIRVRRLGAGRSLKVTTYDSNTAARALEQLLQDQEIASACRSIKTRLHGTDGIGEACRLIELHMPPLVAAAATPRKPSLSYA